MRKLGNTIYAFFIIVVDEDGSLSYTAGLKEELINIYDLRRNLNW